MSRFRQAENQWKFEVEELAADMVEAGMSPGAALVEASNRVSQRRRAKIEDDANRLLASIGKSTSE